MTLAYYAGALITGTSADRTGGTWTNLPAGWRFLETDTNPPLTYYWTGSAWRLITEKDVTEILTGKTLISPAINTPTIKYTDVTKVTGDSPYTIAAGDRIIRADASSGALTVTLPTAVGITGKTYTIKRIDILASSVLVTIATTSSQTIDTAPSHYLWPGEHITLESDGANWVVIDRSQPSLHLYYMLKGTTANKRVCAGMQGIFGGFTTSTTSVAANTLMALPFIVTKTAKFDTISFRITTVSTSGHSRCGIYRDTGNSFPGALIFDTGTIDTTTPAAPNTYDTTITAGLQVLPTGLYWLAYEQDTATGQMSCLSGVATFFALLGNGVTYTSPAYGYTVAHTYGALPDPYTVTGTQMTATPSASVPIPAITLRAI